MGTDEVCLVHARCEGQWLECDGQRGYELVAAERDRLARVAYDARREFPALTSPDRVVFL